MKTNTLSAAIGNIGDKYIARSESSSPARKNHFIRYAAAAAAILLVLGAVFAAVKLLPANAPKQEAAIPSDDTSAWLSPVEIPEDAVLPPARKGAMECSANYKKMYDLAMARDEAEVICVVTVGNWLSDNECCSYFEANVEKVYKGEIPDKIVLRQNESSIADNGSPIFTYGNRLLVFLAPWDNWEDVSYENAYYQLGAGLTTLYFAKDASDNVYLVDLRGIAGSYCRYNGVHLVDRMNADLLKELADDLRSQDKVLGDAVEQLAKDDELTRVKIFALEDVETLIEGGN